MKERLFYLDFVRSIAAISIILIHFNAIYIYAGTEFMNNVVLTISAFNVYLGNWGVSLFFIISGAALMYVYEKKIDIKIYLKKRFLSLYPMFWIAYIIAFCGLYYIYHGMFLSAPRWAIILTIIGFDGYFAGDIPTFYILGEWFLGCIILFYILFPILRKLLLEYPKILLFGSLLIYCVFIYFYHGSFAPAKIVLIRLPEFLLGMYFVKYIKKVNNLMALISLIVLFVNWFVKPPINDSLQTTYIGIATFFVLVYVSYYCKNSFFRCVCGFISKYSYAIFLVHHVIITVVMGYIGLLGMTPIKSYLSFCLCLIIIVLSAIILFQVHNLMMRAISYGLRKMREGSKNI